MDVATTDGTQTGGGDKNTSTNNNKRRDSQDGNNPNIRKTTWEALDNIMSDENNNDSGNISGVISSSSNSVSFYLTPEKRRNLAVQLKEKNYKSRCKIGQNGE